MVDPHLSVVVLGGGRRSAYAIRAPQGHARGRRAAADRSCAGGGRSPVAGARRGGDRPRYGRGCGARGAVALRGANAFGAARRTRWPRRARRWRAPAAMSSCSMATRRWSPPETLARALARRRAADDPAVVALGFEAEDPAGYGRLRLEGGELTGIVEAADADASDAAIRLCNSGVMAVDGAALWSLLERVGADNAKGECYLTDTGGAGAGGRAPLRLRRGACVRIFRGSTRGPNWRRRRRSPKARLRGRRAGGRGDARASGVGAFRRRHRTLGRDGDGGALRLFRARCVGRRRRHRPRVFASRRGADRRRRDGGGRSRACGPAARSARARG